MQIAVPKPDPVERLLFSGTRQHLRYLRKHVVGAFSHRWGAHLYAPIGPRPLTISTPARIVFDEPSNLLRAVPANRIGWSNPQQPARTNLLLRSEDFTTTWANTRSDEVANAATAPDGTLTADKIVATAVSGTHKIRQSVTKAASAIQYCFSVFVQSADYSKVRLELSNSVESASAFAHFDLAAETSADGSTTTFTLNGHGIRRLPGTNWYRIWIVGTTDTDTAINSWVQLQQTGGATSWTGTGADGLYCWGAQLEVGSYPTSYASTTTVAVARAADAMRLVDAALWDGLAAEGSLFGVFRLPYTIAADTRIFALNSDDSDADNYAALLVNSSAAIRAELKNGAGSTTLYSSGVTQAGGTLYAAGLSWRDDFVAVAANGTGGSSAGASPPSTLNQLEFAGLLSTDTRPGVELMALAAFKHALSANELKQLTANADAIMRAA